MIAGFFAGKLMQTIMPYLLGGMAIAVMGLSFTVWYLKGEFQDLLVESADKLALSKANTEKVEAIVERQKLVISTLEEDRKLADERTEKRNDQLATTRNLLNRVRNENASYKSKWTSKLGKKYTRLTTIVNRATLKRVRRIAAITCRSDCGRDSDDNPQPETEPEARSDSDSPL